VTAASAAGQAPEGGWRLNVGGFIKAYPGYAIRADANGYIAQRKTEGRPRGPLLQAPTLDELAAKIGAASS
jgi:hypothetical protein